MEPKQIQDAQHISPNSLNSQDDNWPKLLSDEAYHGLAGDIVRAIEPHTEADSAALLIQFLVAYGNLIGAGPHFFAEDERHTFKLFAVLIGQTSKGRKGSSWARTRKPFEDIDPQWSKDHIVSGLSSGEGLIWEVRDDTAQEAGVQDKRLLVVESEFASVLKMMAREGNTLSPVIRQAWDHGNLRSLTKNSPARATNAHISIIGHITQDELRRYLDRTETGNGFANRFLWVCVCRSKMLPEGGRIQEVDFAPLIERLQASVSFACTVSEIKRDNNAREIWIAHYPSLSEGKPGLYGALVARGEAQVMRMASIFALLDCSSEINCRHLFAAFEIWRYVEDSVRCIFGNALGDPVADTILSSLRLLPDDAYLTRTAINNLFGRHKTEGEISTALNLLGKNNLASRFLIETAGRPAEAWQALRNKRN